jgi:phage repressor protein C with HTH and peptisase S24 domain
MHVAYPRGVKISSPRHIRRQERLQELVEEAGGPAQLQRISGTPSSHISAMLSGNRGMGDQLAAKLEQAMGKPAGWMDEPSAPAADSEPGVELEPAGRPRFMRRIPVVGTAKLGDDGHFERIEGDGWITGYTDDQDAYALRVKGDSMHPAIRHGHFVAVAPNSCCVPGEYVVIELRDGRKMVKELIFERSDEIVIESVNGNHRRTIEKSDIDKMHPVVAIVPPSRWRPD